MTDDAHPSHRAFAWALMGYALMLGLFEGPAQILCIVVLLASIVAGHWRGYRPGLVEAGLLLWVVAGVPGLLSATGKVSSGDATRPLMALSFFVGCVAIPAVDDRLRRRAALLFFFAVVVNAAYGLVQWKFGALPLDSLLLKNPKSGQIWIPGRVFHERAAAGLFYNRLKLAHVGIVALTSAIVLLPALKARWRVSVLGGCLIVGTGMFLTYARASYGVFFIVAVVAMVLEGSRRRALLVLGASAAAFVILYSTEFGRMRVDALLEDFAHRQRIWMLGLRIFGEHPLVGVGHGIYRQVALLFPGHQLGGPELTSPHNVWIQVMAETGIVGSLGFNVAVGAALLRTGRRLRSNEGKPEDRCLDRLGALTVLSLLLIGLVHFVLSHPTVALLFWTAIGICTRRVRNT